MYIENIYKPISIIPKKIRLTKNIAIISINYAALYKKANAFGIKTKKFTKKR